MLDKELIRKTLEKISNTNIPDNTCLCGTYAIPTDLLCVIEDRIKYALRKIFRIKAYSIEKYHDAYIISDLSKNDRDKIDIEIMERITGLRCHYNSDDNIVLFLNTDMIWKNFSKYTMPGVAYVCNNIECIKKLEKIIEPLEIGIDEWRHSSSYQKEKWIVKHIFNKKLNEYIEIFDNNFIVGKKLTVDEVEKIIKSSIIENQS